MLTYYNLIESIEILSNNSPVDMGICISSIVNYIFIRFFITNRLI